MRRHNLRTLLRHLHLQGPTTRTRLGTITGLTRSAVGDLVTELTARELVSESDEVAEFGRPRGRPSLLVAARGDVARVLAVVIGDDTLRSAWVGLGGGVGSVTEIPHDYVVDDPRPSLEQLAALLRRQLADAARPPLAIGVAVPGLVRATDGAVALAPRLGWRDVRLVDELRRRIDLHAPLVTGNDSNLSALAEHLRGAGRDHDHMIHLGSGLGVGGGIILDGRLMQGGHPGYAGEVGHMVIGGGTLPCYCGGHGCWETQVAADAVFRHAGMTVTDGHGRKAALAELLVRSGRGEPGARAAVTALVPAIAAGIATLLSLFNPGRIILDGVFAHLLQHAEPELRAAIAYRRPVLSNGPVDLVPAELGAQGPLLGAAEAAVDAFLAGLRTASTAASRATRDADR
ncbi:ROK family protein [Pseudonocardia kunmingensis]|uniref:Putative NBD/HSP70 family sugar kinase n=1 Tax=Pseudonocardia kunmingensis TaxID=630975 RepID=A0A543DQR0_9PSEU|nr:ROK family protein [Pseudonocardia kunmingensis]TQM11662.1 putative NBD/HSP70 family sugar kinase [Pseudonocardia kunmingensis]